MKKILQDTISQIKTLNTNDNQQLLDRKVINSIKTKKRKTRLKDKYQELINTLEKEYNLNYGV